MTSPSAVMLLVPVPPLTAPVAVTEPPLLVRLKPVCPVEANSVSPGTPDEVLAMVTLPVAALACRLFVVVITFIDPALEVSATLVPELMTPVPVMSPLAVTVNAPSACSRPLTCNPGLPVVEVMLRVPGVPEKI